jgi:gamma-glutamyltranspeptidase/glutathione hydrolase
LANGVARRRKRANQICAGLLAITLTGCATVNSVSDSVLGTSKPVVGTPGFVSGFLGGVVADEPRAALAGREVLSTGGNAADAAVAVALTLSVTYPSRASLGGGGACLAYDPKRTGPNRGVPEAVLFVPPAPAHQGPGDRPAAVPMMARGLFALHARYGKLPFEQFLASAEQLSRFGVTVSRALARDLAVVASPLSADPSAHAVFFQNGAPLGEGGTLVQPDLAATLSQLRTSGVGDFYQGASSRKIADASVVAGGSFSPEDLRAALARLAPGVAVPAGRGDTAVFLPADADRGSVAAQAFQALREHPGATPASSVAGPLPASTTFATLDRDGDAVVCALTMNNLFGTGRIAPGTGIVLAASPAAVPPPLLSAAMAYNGNLRAFRAEAGGSGQEGAPLAAAYALDQALADRSNPPRPMPNPVPEPGRANVIECNRYLPEATGSCGWATDPRSAGLAVGSY